MAYAPNAAANVCAVALVGIAVPAVGSAADAVQDYPTKPVRFLVPQAAGGSIDTIARLVGQKLAERLGKQVVMDNRTGANGIIGLELASKSPPDGYTVFSGGTASIAINPSLYTKLPYDPIKQFAPVSLVAYSTSVLIVHPSVPAKTIAGLIALAKSKPGEIRYASAGSGSTPHLSAEMLRYMTGVNILHVPYTGSAPGVTATVTGETSMMFTGVASAIGHIQSKRLRALSVNGMKRSPALPDVPTAAESGLRGFEVDFWNGIFVPMGTPGALIARLNSDINRIISAPDVVEKLTALGADPAGGTPAEFSAIIRQDMERWAKVVKASGMKVE